MQMKSQKLTETIEAKKNFFSLKVKTIHNF